MSGTGEVRGCGVWRDGGADGVAAVGGGDAGGDSFAGFDSFGEGGAKARRILLGHGRQIEVVGALFGEGEADEAAAKFGHEVDGFGRDELGGEGEIALVFAVFVIDDYDHAAGADLRDGGGDVGKMRCKRSIGHSCRHGRMQL